MLLKEPDGMAIDELGFKRFRLDALRSVQQSQMFVDGCEVVLFEFCDVALITWVHQVRNPAGLVSLGRVIRLDLARAAGDA